MTGKDAEAQSLREIMHARPDATTATTLGELIERGRANLPADVLVHLESGAGDEITLRDNTWSFDRWRFRPSVMTGMGQPDSSTTFLGAPLDIPCLAAPFATDTLVHQDGYAGVARACATEGIACVAPQLGGQPLEDVAAAGKDAVPFAQMYPVGDAGVLRRLVDRAAAVGCTAMCVTVDFATLGLRDRYLRRGWQPDLCHFVGSYPDEERHHAVSLLEEMARIPSRSWHWDDLGSLFDGAPLPFFVKGVLTGEDAIRAVEAGARAVIVSNHGGRQLDGVPAALDQLTEVVDAVGGRVPVGMDGGIRRGRDVVVALARGARVVLLGRLIALALAAAGEAGVRHAVQLLREEIHVIMTLTGRGNLSAINKTLLQ